MSSRFHIVFLLVSSLILVASGKKRDNNSVATFRVYLHEYISGPNATLYEVARANITADSATSFGLVRVADNLMTSGPSINSKKLGRSYVLDVNVGLTESVVMLNTIIEFTTGEYDGSTITINGLRHIPSVNQEFSIVGGTGVFRRPQGYVISYIYSYDPLANHLVIVFDIYL